MTSRDGHGREAALPGACAHTEAVDVSAGVMQAARSVTLALLATFRVNDLSWDRSSQRIAEGQAGTLNLYLLALAGAVCSLDSQAPR